MKFSIDITFFLSLQQYFVILCTFIIKVSKMTFKNATKIMDCTQ